MSNLSFNEFNEGTFDQWLQLVKKELGERALESIDWEVEDGVVIGPYQTETNQDFNIGYAPTQEQYQFVSHADPKEWNRIALESLMGGTNALGIDCALVVPEALPSMLAGIEVKYISVHFANMTHAEAWVHAYIEYLDSAAIERTSLKGSFELIDVTMGLDDAKKWYELARGHFPNYRIFSIDATRVHENGGSIVQELSWALTAGHEHLQRLLGANIPIDDASACLQFNFSIGSSYFAQIAKIRAFRWMWKRIIEAYKPEHDCSVHTYIHASTSRYLQTAKDKHTNLLRATTQAMSAYIGGANSIGVLPYNVWQSSADELSLRWARNIQQLLLEEGYFAQHRTAADGSFYIEELTGRYVKAAWELFQKLDAESTKSGIVAAQVQLDSAVAEHARKQEELVREGKRIIVGVNRYVNKTDSAVVDAGAQTFSAPFEKA